MEVVAISAIMRVGESGESVDHGKCMKFPASVLRLAGYASCDAGILTLWS